MSKLPMLRNDSRSNLRGHTRKHSKTSSRLKHSKSKSPRPTSGRVLSPRTRSRTTSGPGSSPRRSPRPRTTSSPRVVSSLLLTSSPRPGSSPRLGFSPRVGSPRPKGHITPLNSRGKGKKPSRLPVFYARFQSPPTTPCSAVRRRLKRWSVTGRSRDLTDGSLSSLPTMKGSTIKKDGKFFVQEHSTEFKAREKVIFKKDSDNDGMASIANVATMLRSLGFYPMEKQVQNLFPGKQSINFEEFQNVVLEIERYEMEEEDMAKELFVKAADWKNTGKIRTNKLKDICCCYGEKMGEKEWKDFMLIVNPSQAPTISYMEMIKKLEGHG